MVKIEYLKWLQYVIYFYIINMWVDTCFFILLPARVYTMIQRGHMMKNHKIFTYYICTYPEAWKLLPAGWACAELGHNDADQNVRARGVFAGTRGRPKGGGCPLRLLHCPCTTHEVAEEEQRLRLLRLHSHLRQSLCTRQISKLVTITKAIWFLWHIRKKSSTLHN